MLGGEEGFTFTDEVDDYDSAVVFCESVDYLFAVWATIGQVVLETVELALDEPAEIAEGVHFF